MKRQAKVSARAAQNGIKTGRIDIDTEGPLHTSNKSISLWLDTLAGDVGLATAIFERQLDHTHVVNIDGRSYRLRQMEDQAANP